jgi:hypothetical protein
VDLDYVDNYTIGYAELARRAAQYPPERGNAAGDLVVPIHALLRSGCYSTDRCHSWQLCH